MKILKAIQIMRRPTTKGTIHQPGIEVNSATAETTLEIERAALVVAGGAGVVVTARAVAISVVALTVAAAAGEVNTAAAVVTVKGVLRYSTSAV